MAVGQRDSHTTDWQLHIATLDSAYRGKSVCRSLEMATRAITHSALSSPSAGASDTEEECPCHCPDWAGRSNLVTMWFVSTTYSTVQYRMVEYTKQRVRFNCPSPARGIYQPGAWGYLWLICVHDFHQAKYMFWKKKTVYLFISLSSTVVSEGLFHAVSNDKDGRVVGYCTRVRTHRDVSLVRHLLEVLHQAAKYPCPRTWVLIVLWPDQTYVRLSIGIDPHPLCVL